MASTEEIRSGASSDTSAEPTVLLIPGAPPTDGLGGKGAALARLVTAGFPVPETGMVTTVAYRRFADTPKIEALTARISRSTGERSPLTTEQVDQTFASVAVSADLAEAITGLAAVVGAGDPIAVRSSATVEDLHGSSFAGQYRSLLNIDSDDPEAVLDAVRQVWASLWHPAPTAYRRAFGVEESEVAMAVVLMRMIPASSAGVVFTVDPGGASGAARVESVEGLGESLVSGQRTPSAWVVPREGERSTLPPVPERALQLALRAEEHTGTPQDVEWAAADDEVYVVQSRPITVLETSDGFDTEIDDHELTTAGIVEMVPGVLPPLRWEINRFLLEEAFRSVLDRLGVIRGTAAEDRPFVRRVRGRVAIDFDQLRAAAADIPGAVAELEQQYFGMADAVTDSIADSTADTGSEDGGPAGGKRWTWLTNLGRDLRTLQARRQVIDQADVLIRATEALRDNRPALDHKSDEELLAYCRRLIDLAARGLAAELGVAASGAAAYRRLELQLGKYLGAAEGPSAAQRVTAGSGLAVQRPDRSSAAVFGGQTWREIGAEPPAGAKDGDERAAERWEELRQRLQSLPGWTRRRVLTGGFVDIRAHLVKRLAGDVTEQLRRREGSKAAFLELGGEVRRVLLALGRRFAERGQLPQAGDIELLSSDEIRRLIAGQTGPAPDAIRRRNNWLSRYEVEGSLPVRFTGTPDRQPEPLPEGDVLEGWAAGPGRRRAVARVVTSAVGTLERGEVLVAESTDASWSPLFMKAGAVVVERGGPLSHAAILARELGLPAVLNVKGACRLLDGRTVAVDGDRGLVVIESEDQRGGDGHE